MKEAILTVFWFPAMLRVCLRYINGGFFVFRDESVEFLRYMRWYLRDVPPITKKNYGGMITQLNDEIAMRERRGEWA